MALGAPRLQQWLQRLLWPWKRIAALLQLLRQRVLAQSLSRMLAPSLCLSASPSTLALQDLVLTVPAQRRRSTPAAHRGRLQPQLLPPSLSTSHRLQRHYNHRWQGPPVTLPAPLLLPQSPAMPLLNVWAARRQTVLLRLLGRHAHQSQLLLLRPRLLLSTPRWSAVPPRCKGRSCLGLCAAVMPLTKPRRQVSRVNQRLLLLLPAKEAVALASAAAQPQAAPRESRVHRCRLLQRAHRCQPLLRCKHKWLLC